MLSIEDIKEIQKKSDEVGYNIVFTDGRAIWVTKARAIVALLLLIKYGEGSESDLANGSQKIPEIKKILEGKYPTGLIRDFYSDANKPFSELWNEEGFSWIKSSTGQRKNRSQSYILLTEDHEKLFTKVKKAFRKTLTDSQVEGITQRLPNRCNLCGAKVLVKARLLANLFSRDRLRRCLDHRIPIEKGGSSSPDNFQILCFYCNKSKWQICDICPLPDCSPICALSFPERSSIVAPTNEDISDRLAPS